MKLKSNVKSFKLCGRKGCGGCPEVSFDSHDVYINDDYGNRVQMSIDEFFDILRKQEDYLESEECCDKESCDSLSTDCCGVAMQSFEEDVEDEYEDLDSEYGSSGYGRFVDVVEETEDDIRPYGDPPIPDGEKVDVVDYCIEVLGGCQAPKNMEDELRELGFSSNVTITRGENSIILKVDNLEFLPND